MDRQDRLYRATPLAERYGLVTGGGRGIGRAISTLLAQAGAYVLVGYRENLRAASDTVEAIESDGGRASPLCVDVTDGQTTDLDVDFLVNNAGVTHGRSVVKTDRQDWQCTLDVNLSGAFGLMQAVLPCMIERGYGRIVNVTSVVGIDGRLGPTSYAASKAGLIGLTKAAARELARKGVTVNAVAPGCIDETGLLDQVPEHLREKILDEIPMGRFGKTDDIAQAVLYLIAYGDYVTGTVLNVSGGWVTA